VSSSSTGGVSVAARFCFHREPDNTFDRHAIRVDYYDCQQQLLSQQNDNSKKKLGYITSEQAKLLSPWIDRGLVVIINDHDNDSDYVAAASRLVSDSAIELSVTIRACREARELLESV
jgi:HIRAN domain